jgi:hypothetical protein
MLFRMLLCLLIFLSLESSIAYFASFSIQAPLLAILCCICIVILVCCQVPLNADVPRLAGY